MESEPILRKKGDVNVQVKSLLGIGFVEIGYYAAISCLAPFFTKEAERKGMSVSVVSIVFVASPLVLVVTSPFLGKMITCIGTRRCFFTGMVICAVTNITFGFLHKIDSSFWFAVSCILCRAVAGLGSVAMCTNMIFLVKAFPNEINRAMGFNEIFAGIGASLGPSFGGILYDYGGFSLPFWSLGTFMLCLIPVSASCLPEVDDQAGEGDRDEAKTRNSILSPTVILSLIVTFVFSCGWTFIDPILEPRLRKEFGISSSAIGTAFFVMAAAYMGACIILGKIADRVKNPWVLTVVGCFGSGTAILWLDPSLLMAIPNVLWTKVCTLGLLGLFVGMGLAPIYGTMIDDAMSRGFPDSTSTHGTLSGFWNSLYALGDVFGPTFGAVMTQHFGFDAVCTIVSAAFVVMALLYYVNFTWACHTKQLYNVITNASQDGKDLESTTLNVRHSRHCVSSGDLPGLFPPLIQIDLKRSTSSELA